MAKGAWPPASPWVCQFSWYDATGAQKNIVLSIRFDSPVNGGGTNALQGVDYDLDPACPWAWLIVVRSDGTRITHQIPRVSRTGTITAAQLTAIGLNSFLDIGSVTVGTTQN
ncbi:hypothetical protein ACFORO_12625 [Amycolatopsis halotolerans]|uniref:Uncharacterized protein n=1 Tax=Amycolatopsis halotolerans TaxID=330083 RepID=A0ABV7QHL9_9PSEU